MAKPAQETICHVTDACGVVHLGLVRRNLAKDGRVLAFGVATVCAPRMVAWNAKMDADALLRDLPQGFDLPKKVTGAGLLVKYEPGTLTAPAITCVSCVALSHLRDVWRTT